ncbi:MAG: GAF domain-containing protein [Chromatiales bacterium]|nr:GAF domain-containing protein [Chromatiales bacterium]
MLADFLGLVVRLTGARAGAVRTPTPDGANLRLLAAIGLSDEICARDTMMPASCGMCGAALQTSLTRQASAVIGCPMREGATATEAFSGRAVAVPLDHHGRPIGVLNLFFPSGQNPPAGITRLLRPFGQVLGMALENERLTRENLRAALTAERQTMAAEVHDSLAQSLAFVQHAHAAAATTRSAATTSARAQATATTCATRSAQAHAGLREHDHALPRAAWTRRAWSHALRELREPLPPTAPASSSSFDNRTPELQPARRAARPQVFHIVQEALANVARHAGARARAGCTSTRGADELRDRGRGRRRRPAAATAAPAAGEAGHYGLAIMRERARPRSAARCDVGALPARRHARATADRAAARAARREAAHDGRARDRAGRRPRAVPHTA